MNPLRPTPESAEAGSGNPRRLALGLGGWLAASRIKTVALCLVCMPVLLVDGTLSLNAAPAANISSGFDAANRLYEQGKFTEAVAAYEKLLESGAVSPAIYFNLGNAFYKAGKIGNAIAAYRKAELSAPRDPDVRANLRFVRDQIEGPTSPPGRWERWLGRLTLNEWAVLVSVSFWLWLCFLAAIQFRPAWRPSLRTLTLLSGSATGILGACLAAALLVDSAKTAVVVTQEAVVRNGPLAQSPTAFVVHDGAELKILDRKNGWYKVSAANRIGWLKQHQVVVLSRKEASRESRLRSVEGRLGGQESGRF